MERERPQEPGEPIAIIGMALRAPGADTPERLWDHILAGRDTLTRPDSDALRREGFSKQQLADPSLVSAVPSIADLDYSDTAFFDIPDFEAELLDPGHKLFLECVWEALECAGVAPGEHMSRTGVFAGSEGDYFEGNLRKLRKNDGTQALAVPLRVGNFADFFPARASHKFGFEGPSFSILSACATSLVATHVAMQSLRRGEIDYAVAGGATVLRTRRSAYFAGAEGMMSRRGRVCSFDSRADGTVFGSGVGVVLLRRLDDAIADGHPIHAIIRGSAVSNDGDPDEKESFVAPSPEGQMAAITSALQDAGVGADSIGYVEAHGTATLLGDPIEVAALTRVFRDHTDARGFCGLGSVKANVGHLRAAAGVISMIKTCFALRHRTLPPAANFEQPNPRLDLANSPFFVNRDPLPWEASNGPRRAGVSSFGFGGSNAHVILEEYVPDRKPNPSVAPQLIILSARTEAALARQQADLGAHLQFHPELSLQDVAYTLQIGRTAFRHRACFYLDPQEFNASDLFDAEMDVSGIAAPLQRDIAFLFPGQGAQRPGMAWGLYTHEPVYREVLDRCATILEPELGLDIRDLIRIREGVSTETASSTLKQTAHAQPALFVVEYAMAQLFLSWGIRPAIMLGHSVGELVAACLAGVFSLADGLKIVAARSRLMQECEPGSMAAVFLSADALVEKLPEGVELGTVNGPELSVVSGPTRAVDAYCSALDAEGIGHRRLATSHAFHSWMMDDALPGFRQVLETVALSVPRIPFVSNLTGKPITDEQATDPTYWADHIRHTVQFSRGLETVEAHGKPVYLEVGPASTLVNLIRHQLPEASAFAALPEDAGNEPRAARLALASAWTAGGCIDWAVAHSGSTPQRVTLPTYPFQRYRHYIEPNDLESKPSFPLKLYEPGWTATEIDWDQVRTDDRPWLVFADTCGVADGLIARLNRDGGQSFVLYPGETLKRVRDEHYTIRPANREDLGTVLAEIRDRHGGAVPRVVHLWSVTGAAGEHNSVEAFNASTWTGSHTLTALIMAANDRSLCDGLDITVVADAWTQRDQERLAIHAEKGGLIGPLRCIPQEFPQVTVRAVDLPEVDSGGAPEWVCDRLYDEVRAGVPTWTVLLRPEGRYLEAMYPAHDIPLSRFRLRERGVVLITGGVGGLGLLAARSLFDAVGARIALTSRWMPPDRSTWEEEATRDDKVGIALREVLALEAAGAEVMIVVGDMADYDQVSRMVDEVEARWGAVHGVVHAAGIVGPTLVMESIPERIERLFLPKVHGAFHLERRLGKASLDFFVHFSSQSSYLPAAGQLGYGIANGVLDALARRRAASTKGLSCAIGWGPWEEVGMGASVAKRSQTMSLSERLSEAPARVEPLQLPLFQSCRHYPSGRLAYRGVFAEDEPGVGSWVLEHRFHGRPLLSGAAIIECVRSTYQHHVGAADSIELSDIAFLRPLFVHQCGVEVEIVFTPEGECERFEVRMRPRDGRSPWVSASTGSCARGGPQPAVAFPPPSGEFTPPSYTLLAHQHISAGPRWNCVTGHTRQEDAVWTEFQLDTDFHGDLDHFVLHPATFDLALHGGHHGLEVDSVPLTIGSLRIFQPPGDRFFMRGSHRLAGDTPVFHVQLVDEAGRLLVDVEEYIRRGVRKNAPGFSEGVSVSVADSSSPSPSTPATFRARLTRPGDIESIALQPAAIPEPAPNEVVIQTVAASLNFRDVLTALDQMPDALDEDPPLGVECSGRIYAVGDKVTGFKPGDPVVAFARYSFASHVVAKADLVMPVTRNIPLEDAAGIPTVFLTATHALTEIGRLKKGERVLIHAAAGGVGLAAVQIAQQIGAEIFATAGRDEKRDHLRALGVEHVLDSRSLRFVEDIRELTGGEGVDLVLNSLAGEFIPASLSLLRSYGRFVEIGKRDIYDDAQLGLYPFRNNLLYAAVDLGKMIDDCHPGILELFDKVMQRFASGVLKPIPTHVIPIEDLCSGFERMARAEHIGKIVFRVCKDHDPWLAVFKNFQDMFGRGVRVEAGVEAFRRMLSCDQLAPCVFASGLEWGEVEVHGARPSITSGGRKARPDIETPYCEPRDDTESELVAMWEKLVGISPVGIDDEFFALGGDSINAIQIQYAVNERFGVRLPTTVLFDHPTIRSFAPLIQGRP